MPKQSNPARGPEVDPRVDAYIEAAAPFARPILIKLRAAFHAGCPDLVERIKWGVPSFERTGMLGGMAAFKQHVSFGFWRAAEMDDPDGLLGEVRKASPMRVQFRDVKELPAQKVLVAYVKQAARLDAAGKPSAAEAKASKATQSKKIAARAPKEMLDAIRASARAAAFWDTLAPSYRRDYIEWITEAKREATRAQRLAQTVEWLGEGKKRNWKYESC